MVSVDVRQGVCAAFSLLNFFASTIFSRVSNEYDFADTSVRPNSKFDFIIVGAGSAGCVLANRLSENPNWRILLLEAGCDNLLLERSPSASSVLVQLLDQKCIWNDIAEPHGDILRGVPVLSPTGRTLGGGGAISESFYSRGNKRDFNDFAARGNIGWDYESVLQYFKKSEGMSDPVLSRSSYHGKAGPLSVVLSNYSDDAVVSVVKKAFEDTLDLPETDYNGRNQVGTAFVQHLLRDGQRESAKTAYLRPALGRENLFIKTFSRVTRIIIDPETRQAKGVVFVHKGRKTSVYASKEVILSAGAVRTPQLLMLSGVGPRDHLESLGIEVIRSIPVGQNLQDHLFLLPTFPLAIDVSGGPKSSSYPGNPSTEIFRPSQVLTAYRSFRSGDPSWPDVQLEVITPVKLDGCLKIRSNSILQTLLVVPILLQPKSVGEIRLADTDPFSDPQIDPRYLSRREDVQVLADALKYLLRLNNSAALREAGLEFKGVPPSVCCVSRKNCIQDDEYWECVVRSYSTSAFSLYGSCKMGPDTDLGAVVDPQLRVRGIRNLRVVDGSALPSISANILAPIVMMAEKASDLIKVDWDHSKPSRESVDKILNHLRILLNSK